MGETSAQPWQADHPFIVGQVIYAAMDLCLSNGATIIAANSAVTVYMCGHDDVGHWVGLKYYPGNRFSASCFLKEPLA